MFPLALPQDPFSLAGPGKPILWDRGSTLHWTWDALRQSSAPSLPEALLPEEVTCVPRVEVTGGLFKPRHGTGLGYEGPGQPLSSR